MEIESVVNMGLSITYFAIGFYTMSFCKASDTNMMKQVLEKILRNLE